MNPNGSNSYGVNPNPYEGNYQSLQPNSAYPGYQPTLYPIYPQYQAPQYNPHGSHAQYPGQMYNQYSQPNQAQYNPMPHGTENSYQSTALQTQQPAESNLTQ